MNLSEVRVRPVLCSEEPRYQELMHDHHYLGALAKISETIRYVAIFREQWVALLSFSAPALKCAARDQWIGWSYRHQFDRLKLLTNNSRFLILPDCHVPNLGSRVLSLCQKRLPTDWQKNFGHPVILLETFVDPHRFLGTVYRAANWLYVGDTKGYRRTGHGYGEQHQAPKMVFIKPLKGNARTLLCRDVLFSPYRTGGPKIMLEAKHMHSLPSFFAHISDPRRAQGRRHPLPTVLAIAAGAVLCGMRGYHAISDWAENLSPKARARFGCRRTPKGFVVPSEYIIRNVLIRVDPEQLDHALARWNQVYGQKDQSLAIDGKTMCNAIDEQGRQVHIMSVIGHQSKACLTQKK
ncbi:Druantia anti-phage system protein DruA [Thermodesulfobacteriota bacterium]